ncbi:MAG TPA: hypothetical protein VGI70_10180, partial [Polyangiales bacterium]
EELLSDPPCSTPLIAGGVLCHGGFGSEGEYRSPRTLHRNPAVLAWQAQLTAAGHALIDIDDALLPPQYPSVAQAKLLLERGHREPIVRALTVISIVEGFGAIIRDVRVPDLASSFVESIEGTALAHLERGLFEAHARDEAGYRDQGGHKQMWEAARDLALEHPKVPSDVFMRLMGNRGQARAGDPLFPQLDKSLYRMLTMMTQVYAIEMFAKRTFEWGIALLSDDRVSAAPKAAGDMVRFIQSDEAPHVQYLRTALSEVRARTLRGVDGSAIAGRTVVDVMLHAMLVRSIDARPREQRGETRGYLERAVSQGEANASLLEEFDALAPSFAPPSKTGFEPVAV